MGGEQKSKLTERVARGGRVREAREKKSETGNCDMQRIDWEKKLLSKTKTTTTTTTKSNARQ